MSNDMAYGPPPSDSDSDSSYDGFYFSDKVKKSPKPQPTVEPDQKLYEALLEGDVKAVIKEIDSLRFNENDPIRWGRTMLMYACREGHYDLAAYLLEKRSASANKQVETQTPLMEACDCEKNDPYLVEKLVRLLLRHGAAINVSNKCGMTPLMFACRNGYTSVVRLIVKDASLNAVDHVGCTALFHAIEKNRADIVKLLVEAGVNAMIPNGKGYTPTQEAESYGYYDLLELLPRTEETYSVPLHFLCYHTLRDHIPRIFLKTECPEYFQELKRILQSIDMQDQLHHFAISRTSLAEFLVMDDQALKKVGIPFPVQRNKILKGILDFHLHHWSYKSIARVKMDGMDNFYDILMITASHMQQLVIIQASLDFVKKNLNAGVLGKTSTMQLASLKTNIMAYRKSVDDLTKTVKYLGSFSPAKNPLHIDYNDILAVRKRTTVRRYFKYTTIILGISVFICLKSKWFGL
ncbi:ankyrin repeat, SAM and basic leucine zipper domain-containing protein 1-like isoform X2 [Drosophila miranda]|uniref:ankyrin repeat, SAM and basic leucine zipper domain-containing protein 1-like isoform X1 n=1 Tax=Drosophila miranda TaxID=7229 RepID=UPI00143F531A|nr:ankyrin repeat, SAM and basic leucine zipper domain-containing protein 1-like isoform X1 [Drosophila miranda]XP_033252433.1 ankyrin repeat, SAM and basic leucine zipper domain-containing protein 1-like isoform X2 [Drosophila miranda]